MLNIDGIKVYLKSGGDDKNEKVISKMGQDMPRLQYRSQISGFIHRQESEKSLGKGLPFP